jgi:hypothetical protein
MRTQLKKAKITAANNLDASLTELADPSMRPVVKACQRANFKIPRNRLSAFFVISFKNPSGEAHFIYAHAIPDVPDFPPEALKEAIKAGRWMVLGEAWFIVYHGKAYAPCKSHETSAIINAVQYNTTPQIAAVLTGDEGR